jgi:hypothetical protein
MVFGALPPSFVQGFLSWTGDHSVVSPRAPFSAKKYSPAKLLPQSNPRNFALPNFDCGIQRRAADGHRYLYSYNCTSEVDELFDLDSGEHAVNLIAVPDSARVRKELIQSLGSALQTDPRWASYWAEFRIARFSDLPRTEGDMQLFSMPD